MLGLSPALSVVYRGRGGLEVGPFGRRKVCLQPLHIASVRVFTAH